MSTRFHTQRLLAHEISPQLDRFDYSIRRYYVDEFHLRHVPCLPKGALILDVGGNKIDKRGAFDLSSSCQRAYYVNVSTSKRPDLVATGETLPVAARSVDAIICSEVLEHVFEPIAVIAEFARVLKPGGQLLLCAPFQFRIHADPEDYGRYTDAYWRRALTTAGFETSAVEFQGHFFGVFADSLKHYANRIEPTTIRRRWQRWALGRLVGWLFERDTKAFVEGSEFLCSFTTGFGVVATRANDPSRASAGPYRG